MKKHLPLVMGLGLLLLTGWVAAQMYQRDAQQLLWGYRPLWLFGAGWAALTLLAAAFWQWRGRPVAWRWLGLSTLTGVLLGVGFPDLVAAPWLLWVGWLPLLLVADEVSRTRTRVVRSFWPYAYHALVVWNILATYWVANAALAAGVFAILANSLLMSLPWVGWLLTRRLSPRLGWAPLVAYWLTFEYVHLRWDLTWPWLTLGNGFAEYPSWIQWYEYTGAFGGSLWVWLLNLALYRAYTLRQAGANPLQPLLRAAALLVLPLGLSAWIYTHYTEQGQTIDVVVVQPNYEPHYEKFDIPEETQLERFIALSLSRLDTTVDYLVFPESSFGYVEETRIGAYAATRRLREALAAYPDLRVVTGLNAYHDFQPGEPHSRAVRERRGYNGQVIHYEALNSAAQFSVDPDDPIQTYRKSKLVPGPEAFPFQTVLFFMKPVVEQLDGTTAGLGTQPERGVFESPAGRVAPVICYESVFGEYFAGYVRKGAQAAFIMTNDGWWDHTAGHRQHLYFASLRTIETRRPIARSANTGISAFVNQRGDISQPLAYNTAGAIRAKLTLQDQPTFYVQWGDAIGRVALFLTLIFALNTVVRGRLPKA